MKYLLVSACVLTIQFIGLSQDIKGAWINELGSILAIDSIAANGVIIGSYISSSGVDGKVFRLTGAVNRGSSPVISISFSVLWDGYSSITSWTGYIDTDQQGRYIKTMWHLVRPDEVEPWERIITNSSTFRPVQQK